MAFDDHVISTFILPFAGRTYLVEVAEDPDAESPWHWCDTLGSVSGPTTRNKHAGERVLSKTLGSCLLYDFAAAVRKARASGSPGKDAAACAEAEFERLRRWARGDWFYVWVSVSPINEDGDVLRDKSNALWGVESDPSYIREVALELASQYL